MGVHVLYLQFKLDALYCLDARHPWRYTVTLKQETVHKFWRARQGKHNANKTQNGNEKGQPKQKNSIIKKEKIKKPTAIKKVQGKQNKRKHKQKGQHKQRSTGIQDEKNPAKILSID